MRTLLSALSVFLAVAFGSGGSNAQAFGVLQVMDYSLRDVAALEGTIDGRLIMRVNPNMCDELGEACTFYLQHEWAHVRFRHLQLLSSGVISRTQAEASADCYAASIVGFRYAYAAYLNILERTAGSLSH